MTRGARRWLRGLLLAARVTVDQLLARPMDRRQIESELLGATSL